jgi:hypothetical protein
MKYLCYMKSHLFLLLLLGTMVNIFFGSLEININHNNLQLTQIAFGHNFTPNESVSFLAFVEQLQTESELVQANLANNNISLAQQHANNAAVLLTPNITREIAEQNQRIAKDLTMAINDLQDITSPSQQQGQSIDQLVSNIDAILGEAVTTRIEQEQKDNATIQALAFADLVDGILVNYGNAYAVDFDMTNMSNMAIMGGNSSSMAMSNSTADDDNNSNSSNSMNTDSMDMSSSSMMMNMESNNRNYVLVDMADYQSAQALAAKAQEIFNTELKVIAPNNSSAFINNLEKGLTQLNDVIRNKSSPMDIMMIVHMQVHPNLLRTFGLGLR